MSAPVASADPRLMELEVKLTFADDALDALNRTVFRQQQQIDALQREFRILRQQMQSSQSVDPAGPLDEIPPHY